MAETIQIPAAVDLHVHFREPGDNKSETIASGTRAAKAGGYGLVCDMPNNPGCPTWTSARVKQKKEIIKKSAQIPVLVYAGAQPESNNLGELERMSADCVGLKLYGAPTTGNDRDYEAADFADIIKTWHEVAPEKPIMLHSGKANLKDFIDLIAGEYKHNLHVCHVNSPSDVGLVTKAKIAGLKVTCGVCPHHLFLSRHDEKSRGWFARMQPPLAAETEADELFGLLTDGEIDVVETDHAPHGIENKWAAEEQNPSGLHGGGHRTCYGVPSIEFALPLLFYQMSRGRITKDRIIEITSTNPTGIIGIEPPKKQVSWEMTPYRIGHEDVVSASGWTPFDGMMAVGKIVN